MDLSAMALEQLKALCYDQLVLLEQIQNNIKLLNEEIKRKSSKPTEEIAQ